MILQLALYFVAVTVLGTVAMGMISMAMTAPWWVTLWVAIFLIAGGYLSYKLDR
jgi:hypothetical protein